MQDTGNAEHADQGRGGVAGAVVAAGAGVGDDVDRRALAALKRYFGYDSFRSGQAALVNAMLHGRDVLGVMPTGAGKSVCYQIPAMLLDGLTIVVSPLISLMRDQVDALNDIGIPAAFINTTQDVDEQSAVLDMAAHGGVRILYVAPERLETSRFRAFAAHARIALVAVDEAHCVSQWGQDFRSSYLGIGEFIDALPSRPIVAAFTATATERVRGDIVALLGLRDPQVTVTGFDRTNLYFDIRNLEGRRKAAWIASAIAAHPGESGIVYCATRKDTETLAAALNKSVPALREARGEEPGGGRGDGPIAVAYHGGMAAADRDRAQRAFVTDRVPVVVATNAFGMGIDKSNVRFVIHHNLPESVEAYYQEAGRAGRDGEPARCTLLWNDGDIMTRRRLLEADTDNDRMSAEDREINRASKRRLLDAMVGYCRTTECLHTYMMRYFGDASVVRDGASVRDGADVRDGVDIRNDAGDGTGHDAGGGTARDGAHGRVRCVGGCVNCDSEFETIDVTDIAKAISRCVHDVMYDFDAQGRPGPFPARQGLGSGKIVAVLRGARTQELLAHGLDHAPSYGRLGDVPQTRIRDVLNQMESEGFLVVSAGRLPIVGFGGRAGETVGKDFHYVMKRVVRPSRSRSAAGGSASSFGAGGTSAVRNGRASADDGFAGAVLGAVGTGSDGGSDADLFERLRALRLAIAREIGKPPYIIFSDQSLHDMCAKRPTTPEEFLQVSGVGESKLAKYGERFMALIADAR